MTDSKNAWQPASFSAGLLVGMVLFFLFQTKDGKNVRKQFSADSQSVWESLKEFDLDAIRENKLMRMIRNLYHWLLTYPDPRSGLSPEYRPVNQDPSTAE